MENKEFNLKQLLNHFSEIGGKRWGITLQLNKLENVFKPVKEGQEELSLKHIVVIRDDWAFMNWWKMPEIKEEDLVPLKGDFVKLKPKDESVIGKLFDLLKNIEIVSCVLRFIDPQNYGIFSPPVENILKVLGKHQIEKYLNYLGHLTELKEEYDFERIADVDMALWVLANIINYSYIRHHPVFSVIYKEYERTTNLVKKIMARNSLEGIRQEKPLYKAELFLDSDHIVAGLIAGRELDLFVKGLCRRNGIKPIERKEPGKIRHKLIPELLEELFDKRLIKREEFEELKYWWYVRCDLIHEQDILVGRTEIKKMIDIINKLKEEYED